MIELIRRFLSEGSFMPHGHCYLWQPGLLWLHILSDSLIATAYFSIPFTLVYFIRRRTDIPFNWMFLCFAAFIVACGATHLAEIWVIWHPTYWLSGTIKAITALASVPTAVLLVKLIPTALRLPSPAALRKANTALEKEISERTRAEANVQQLNEQLEQRVRERTAELETANAALKQEIADRKAAEEKVTWLASFPEHNPNPIVELDLTRGMINYFNPAATEYFPDLPEKGLTHPLLAGLETDSLPLIQGQPGVIRREVTINGSSFAEVVNCMPDTGRLRVYGTDITARKSAEHLVEHQRAKLQAILDSVPALIFYKDPEGRIKRINNEMARLLGRPRHEIEGKTDVELGTPYAEQYMAMDREIVATGIAKRNVIELLRTATGNRWIETDKIPDRDEQGKIEGIIGFALDITARKQAEERAKAQLARLELLNRITRAIGERQDLQSIAQVVVRNVEDHLPADFAWMCTYDPSSETLATAGIGQRSNRAFITHCLAGQERVPVDQNGLTDCVRGHLVYELDIRQADSPFLQKLADAGLCAVVLAPLLFEGKVFGILVTGRNTAKSFSTGECEFLRQLSEHVALGARQVQLHSALQIAYDDLRQTQQAVMQQERLRALGQMASGVAHDINNSISPVALYIQSLLEREPGLSERARDYLLVIQRAVRDVASTVTRMRDFYRSRESELVFARIDPNEVARHVIELTRAKWKDLTESRGLAIDVQIDLEQSLPPIMGAESELRDAMTNLVLNAIDAMPSGGTLHVRTHSMANRANPNEEAPRHEVSIEVSDTGIGMDEDTRRRCLEPFFTTKGERGTGLGLAMVYGMIQRHTARIEVESERQKGTTVRLIFPAATPATSDVHVLDAPAERLPSLRLLVVDDDPMLIKSLRNILEEDGHAVSVADGGEKGIHLFHSALESRQPFSVVITNLGMAHVDGPAVAAAIKAASTDTQVILLTGWGQQIIAEGTIPPHVDRVLSKPPNLSELREALSASARTIPT